MGARHRIGWLARGLLARAVRAGSDRATRGALAGLVLAAALASIGGYVRADPVAAQDVCVADAEPNDQPTAQVMQTDALCVEGSLPDKDQDLFAWEVPTTDATTRWTFTLSGVENAITKLKLVPITSDPDVEPPTVVDQPLVELVSGPDSRDAAPREDVLIPPGRYILAVVRSNPKDEIPDASIEYRGAVIRGTPFPPSIDAEPNDDAASGAPLGGAFEGSGDLSGSEDHIHWSPGDDPADSLWRVTLQVPVGVGTWIRATTSDGQAYDSAFTTAGVAVIHDLAVDAGGYDLKLDQVGDTPVPYVLTASVEPPTPGVEADPEPNGQAVRALPIDPAHRIAKGRLATVDDIDQWRFPVDAVLASRQLDIRLLAPGAASRRLCLYDSAGTSLQCREATGGVVLSGLFLPVGEYVVEVRGAADLAAPYLLRIDATSVPVPDYETEPNDTPTTASPFDASVVMRGRATAADTDMYRLKVSGDPQLWQIQAVGSGITSLTWLNGDATLLRTGTVSPDGTTATLDDMYLVPGEHRIALEGDGGDYTLRATPMGPPDPDAEREPNDDWVRANTIPMDGTRSGRLQATDGDIYRFTLAAMEHIAIDLDVPDDGATVLDLETGTQRMVQTRGTAVGEDIHYDGLLPPGDYVLWLSPTQASDQAYRLRLRRLDPFARAGDIEPNDTPQTARPIPASGVIDGSGWGIGDADLFQLGALRGGSFTLDVVGSISSIDLVQGDTDVPLRVDADGHTWRTDEAPMGDTVLWIMANGAYTARVGTTGPVDATPAVQVALSFPTTEVAAWWAAGQAVDGALRVTNPTDRSVAMDLGAWSSDRGWTVGLSTTTVTLEPGGSQEIPVSVRIQPDARADTPVAIAVQARPADAQPVSTWTTVTPTTDAAPVGAHRAWAVPDALLGGLDVASVALGGVSDGSIDPTGEIALHDGLAITGTGLTLPVTDPPTPTTVDLAGDEALPIAGIVLDPASGLDNLAYKPHRFQLWLSEDGSTWTSALTGELSPVGIDQAFPLPTPMPARFARLAILTTWTTDLLGPSYGSEEAVLAEWKVIATPGADPAQAPRDIADPALGGHVVLQEPLLMELPGSLTGMLNADLTREWSYPPSGGTTRWVLGFRDDRAALVTDLGWTDPTGSDPTTRSRQVTLEASTDSPLGPWQSLGTWKLDRATDGSVASYHLDTPTWARFLRFSTPGPEQEGGAWELPGMITVLEQPTGGDYRSILGEWGQNRPEGPLEASDPTASEPVVDDPDVGEGADAVVLSADQTARGRVAIGTDADEYLVSVPAGQNSISAILRGTPQVSVRLTLIGPDGAVVPMSSTPGGVAGSEVFAANVTPGVTYRLRVEQPPFSAVLMYDTSLSIAGYWQPILQGMFAFAGDVRPGRDNVLLLPFDSTTPVLPSFTDQPYALQAALEGTVSAGGSGTEASVHNALDQLAGREGARAILLVTDGETSSFGSGPVMWNGLASQRPLVFALQIGGSAIDSTHLLQDLAASSGGRYQYVRTQDDMLRAFDQMATSLRRPASYSLSYATSAETVPPPKPGRLQVVTPPGADGAPTAAPIDPTTAIEIVLDTSGSMRAKLGKTTRIEAAKDVLVGLVRDDLPPGIPVALRWFRLAARSCDTELAAPLAPLDPEAMAAVIQGIQIPKSVRTPLAAAIEEVANDLASVHGRRVVVVVSDGRESCGGDPEAAVEALRAQGFDITLNVIGLGLNGKDRKRISHLADLGGGTYFDANGAGQLDEAVRAAVSAPYDVYDQAGTLVATGVVNGPPLELPPGIYKVVVRTDPEQTFQAAVVTEDEDLGLTISGRPTR